VRRLVLVALVLAGCGKHATKEQAQAACDHQIELGYWQGFAESIKKSGHDPADPDIHAQGVQALAAQRKTEAWQAELSKCTDTYADHASAAQLECVAAAKTADDSLACLK
jgi:hypothetical protein